MVAFDLCSFKSLRIGVCMKKIEALKRARDALLAAPTAYRAPETIAFIDEALAEQPAQQEPVVWMYVNKSTHETKFQKHMRAFVDHGLWAEVPLYGEPLANHELRCICGAVWCGDEMVHLPDKKSPASKPWVGLTDEEKRQLFECENYDGWLDYINAIEAKLREKNA